MGTDQLAYADEGDWAITRSEREKAQSKQPPRVRVDRRQIPKSQVRRASGFRCRACGQRSDTLAAAERHVSETRHARIECV